MPNPKINYRIVSKDGEQESITCMVRGQSPLIATATHPQFKHIVSTLRQAELTKEWPTFEEIKDLFDASAPIGRKFIRLSERVMVNNGGIYFDGVRVEDALTNAIVRFHGEGHEDFMRLVNFMEKVRTNPNPGSVEQLFRWLSQHRFGITADGDFIAYKGVQRRDDVFLSKTSGRAIVNGEVVQGLIPNVPGTIIEMPRDEVRYDPYQACSTGLHAGNWSYARGFGSIVLQVKINPRDVVSVPTDSGDAKLRVCRYRILDEVTREDDTMLFVGADKTKPYVPPAEIKEKKGGMSGYTEPAEDAVVTGSAPKPRRRRTEDTGRAAAVKKVGKRARTQPKVEELVFPEWYELYERKHWDATAFKDLRMVAKTMYEIEVPARATRDQLTLLLMKESKRRKRTWPKDEK